MHCLGAVAGGAASPSGGGSCGGGVLGVVRALGVLVSEGRVQGPPRGYKEGPHCAAPLQSGLNSHECEKDNYLCDRYLVLVRDISDRVAIGSYLCVEVLLCTDCPCGLAKATSKDPVLPISSMSITSWHQSSEMLLECWCISVVPSKGPETMNTHGLYQAVRSRLHFSQVAAWWSRSKGAEPSYITTRVVPYSEDNLRKFREPPTEHTFPLAGCGDGNSIKVTVWALPRMEDVPVLTCPIHPITEKEDEGAARALTPTKNMPAPVPAQNPEALILPALVDDRLQTPCNEPGKHHCRCEEEDGCPPSPSLRPHGERKRRRSLPCGPDLSPCATAHVPLATAPILPSVSELAAKEQSDQIYQNRGLDCTASNHSTSYIQARYSDSQSYRNVNLNSDCQMRQNRSVAQQNCDEEKSRGESFGYDKWMYPNAEGIDGCVREISLAGCFTRQLSIAEQEGNVEKRYKRSVEPPPNNEKWVLGENIFFSRRREKSPKFNKKDCSDLWEKAYTNVENGEIPLKMNAQLYSEKSPLSYTGLPIAPENINCTTSAIGGKETEFLFKRREKSLFSVPRDTTLPVPRGTNFIFNPFGESSPFHESNPGPSTYSFNVESKMQTCSPTCKLHQDYFGCTYINKPVDRASPNKDANRSLSEKCHKDPNMRNLSSPGKDLTQLMSNLTVPEDSDRTKEEGGILDWISKVPSRVLGVTASNGSVDDRSKITNGSQGSYVNEVKSKQNCNLELSQREFDEVLAVLRARTPSGRRRAPLRTIRRRDKSEKYPEESISDPKSNFKAISTNLEGYGYPIHYEVNGVTMPDRSCNERFSKRTDERVRSSDKTQMEKHRTDFVKWVDSSEWDQHQSEQSFWPYEDKCVSVVTVKEKTDDEAFPALQKLAEGLGYSEKRVAEPKECLHNVTNKADVLLGAILRTSKESRKGLSDISNGARPRTALATEKCENRSNPHTTKAENSNQTLTVIPFEDEKSFPSVLNKRLNKFKQLFKKEQAKKKAETLTSGANSEELLQNSEQFLNVSKLYTSCHFKAPLKHPKETRVKRKIDFSDYPDSAGWHCKKNESLAVSNESFGSTNSAHQNPTFYSTNSEAKSSCMKANEPHGESEQSYQNGSSTTQVQSDLQGDQHFEQNGMKYSTNIKPTTHNGCAMACETMNGHTTNYEGQNGFSPICSQKSSPLASRVARHNNLERNVFSFSYERQNSSDTEDSEASDRGVPSAIEQERFRRSLGNAASMVFHSRTGLPLTSSPAPLRRGSCCFDYDSSLNSVSSKRSALFELNTPPSPGAVSLEEGDRETENTCEGEETPKRRSSSRGRPHSHALLGSFEESALNGRLEPVSTVHGFTAELGASGSFCPKHRKLPVTVFFYTLGDNDKVSTPYLAHINLGKKGYQVPRSGTIQVTLLNPLGTVVKMFVVLYDLSDMPPRSHTFLRQRTLREKTLRYLVHLRFMSGKSGRIYLHTDIRMIICRKSNVDTASDLGAEPPKELRSFVHGPTNPKFSPRC